MDESFKPMMDEPNKKKQQFSDLIIINEKEGELEVNTEKKITVAMIEPEEIEKIKKNAYEEGYQLGIKEAILSIKEKKEELNELIKLAVIPASLVDEQVQSEVIKLSAWLAKSILHKELTVDPQKIMMIFDELKELLPNINQMRRLYLCPEDHEFILTLFNEDEMKFPIEHLQSEPALSRGEYRVETKDSEVDASVESRLQELVLTTLKVQGVK